MKMYFPKTWATITVEQKLCSYDKVYKGIRKQYLYKSFIWKNNNKKKKAGPYEVKQYQCWKAVTAWK